MLRDVYLTRISKVLPNSPVSNDEIEDVIGTVAGRPSRAKRLVLKQNGIQTRYYVTTRDGRISHNNAQLTAEAIRGLVDKDFSLKDLQLLCCGTASPDQLAPPHASMVHGELKCPPLEVISNAGVCNSSMQALKHGFLSVRAGETRNAVCTGSETASLAAQAKHYDAEVNHLQQEQQLEKTPMLAFEKDFLRFMLSDGAAAVLLENQKRPGCLKLEWMDCYSFANEAEACMYVGMVKTEEGGVKGWLQFSSKEIHDQGILAGRQDIRLLEKHGAEFAARAQAMSFAKHELKPEDIDYYLPHLSSEFFRMRLADRLKQDNLCVPLERWFTNLHKVGNVGSASILLALEELMHSGKLKTGQKVFLAVPESSRFSYYGVLLTAC